MLFPTVLDLTDRVQYYKTKTCEACSLASKLQPSVKSIAGLTMLKHSLELRTVINTSTSDTDYMYVSV